MFICRFNSIESISWESVKCGLYKQVVFIYMWYLEHWFDYVWQILVSGDISFQFESDKNLQWRKTHSRVINVQ